MITNESTAPRSDDVYWATDSPQRVAEELSSSFAGYTRRLRSTGMWDLYRKAYREYFGLNPSGDEHETSMVSFDGVDGELAYTRANHFRNLVRHRVIMATSTSPNFEPKPASASIGAVKQIVLARNIVSFYSRQFLPVARQALEAAACAFARSYVWAPWDRMKGRPLGDVPLFHEQDVTDASGNVVALRGEPTGESRKVFEGDMEYRMVTPLDVMVARGHNPERPAWAVVRVMENRWDLMARYPESANEIRDIVIEEDSEELSFLAREAKRDSDEVPVLYAYVEKTPAIPEGRYMVIVAGAAVEDGPLPYDRGPLFRCAPTEMFGTDEGYADAWDLVGMSRAYNSITSTLLTISDNLRGAILGISSGSHIDDNSMMSGYTMVRVPDGAEFPKVIQQSRLTNDDFALADKLRADMELVSGVNGAKRGDPASNVKSAKMASLMDQMASQFNVGDQEAFNKLTEALATHTLRCLRLFATEERLVPMSGDSTSAVASFVGEDVSLVGTVTVETQPPMPRWSLAEMAYQRGELNLTEMVDFMNTGKLPEKNKNAVSQRALAEQENVALMETDRVEEAPGPMITDPRTGAAVPGPPMNTTPDVPVLVSDDHVAHVQICNLELANPLVRYNPRKRAVFMAHMEWHKRLAESMDPMLATLLNAPVGQPMPPPPPMGQGDGEPGPEPGTEQEEQNARTPRASRSADSPNTQKG